MSVFYGIVRKNVIVLPEGVHLAEGAAVEIRVQVPRRKRTAPVHAENRFKQRLLKLGLLSEIKPQGSALRTEQAPIAVPGKPLSEIVIEERR